MLAPAEVLSKPGPLTQLERQEIDRIPLHTIKIMMRQRTMDRPLAERIIAVYEHRIEFARSLRDPSDYDNTGGSPQKSVMSLFGRILAITHTFDGLTSPRPWRDAIAPEAAIRWMAGEMRRRFDPFLLNAFIRVMANVPTRELENDEAKLSVI